MKVEYYVIECKERDGGFCMQFLCSKWILYI